MGGAWEWGYELCIDEILDVIYCPQGAPSFVRLYEYPRLEGPGAIVASKSFYRADTVSFLWNNKGEASNSFPTM